MIASLLNGISAQSSLSFFNFVQLILIIHVNWYNLSYLMSVVIAFGIIWNLIASLLNGISAQSSLSFFNFVQLILIIPLIGTYLSPNVFEILKKIINTKWYKVN